MRATTTALKQHLRRRRRTGWEPGRTPQDLLVQALFRQELCIPGFVEKADANRRADSHALTSHGLDRPGDAQVRFR